MKYYIHDNGGRPFMVETNNTTGVVNVYKRLEGDKYAKEPLKTFTAQHIFVGKSPLNKMTKFSSGHGKAFEGNTLLLHIDDKNYVYIGREIFSFKSLAKITKYLSPVGNNDVPYPYATDENGKTYLISEGVVLDNFQKNSVYDDPYDYYYHASLITADIGFLPPKQPILTNELNIVDFYIGDDQYSMRYRPNPAKEYDRVIPELGTAMYIVTKESKGVKKLLSKNEYVKFIKKFGKQLGARMITGKKVLVKRG